MDPEIEKCKKCGYAVKDGPGVEVVCACEVGIDIDENGEPLYDCGDHGIHSGADCPGCERVERDIDEAIEKDHQKGGRYGN